MTDEVKFGMQSFKITTTGSKQKASSTFDTDLEDEHLTIYDDFAERVSKPHIAPNYTLPIDGSPVLGLAASFGYDSHRPANLQVLDANTLLFVAGSYVRVYRLDTKQNTFVRCTGNGSVSCLVVLPNRLGFASGERGNKPDINIFGCPSFKLRKVLKNGTQKEYVSMMFEPIAGDLLASQGGEPDYNITIWHWVKEIPLLRCKSFSQDVHKVAFSKEHFGCLVTSGMGHIRFWTMAKTFTGLKLQGQTGRFGGRDPTNIEAFVNFSNAKVLSGSEEGTLLLWEEAVLKAEFVRKQAPNCHQGKINQMLLCEDEILTLGEDGYIRTWHVDEIVFVEPSYPGERFRLNPLMEIPVGAQSSLVHMTQADPSNPECYDWYAQDRAGRIWYVDLSIMLRAPPSKVLLQFHGGPVLACAASHSAHLMATAGQDGTVRIFDCLEKSELLCMAFSSPAFALVWVPLEVDVEGASVIVGFDDGVIRKLAFRGMKTADATHKQNVRKLEGKLSQAFKPHKNRVTSLLFSPTENIFATGSWDKTVFLFSMNETQFEPIGWLSVPSGVKQLVWTPSHFVWQGLMAVCEEGIVVQMRLKNLVFETDISVNFQIPNPKLQLFKFHSIKSEVQHAEALGRLEGKRSRLKSAGKPARNEEDPNDVEEEDESLLPEEEEWDTPSPILQALYSHRENYFWVTLGDYDVGYVYLCRFPESYYNGEDTSKFLTKPEKAVAVPNCSDIPITVMKVNETPWQQLALLGFQNGHVRLVQLPQTVELDNLSAYWDLNVHDEKYGSLTGMEFAFDCCYLVTTGMDGNILMFSYTGLMEMSTKTASAMPVTTEHHDTCSEDISTQALWFAAQIAHEKQEQELMEVEAVKKQKRQILGELQNHVKSLLLQNKQLPARHRLTRQELLVDTDLEKKHADRQQEKIAEIHKMYAWQSEKTRLLLEKARSGLLHHEDLPSQIAVKAFNQPLQVKSYRVPVTRPYFEELVMDGSPKKTGSFKERQLDSNAEKIEEVTPSTEGAWKNAYFLTKRRSTRLEGTVARSFNMMLNKAFRSERKRHMRQMEWDQLYKEKVNVDKDSPEELLAIEYAKLTFGDVKLKTDPVNAVAMAHTYSKSSAYRSLVQLDKNCRDRITEFNKKLMRLRDYKIVVMRVFRELDEHLQQISYGVKNLPDHPRLSEEEVPEKKFVFDEQILYKFKKDCQVLQDAAAFETDSVFHPNLGQIKTPKEPLYRHVYYKGERSDIPDIVEFVLRQNFQKQDKYEILDLIVTGEAFDFDLTSTLRQEINMFSRLQIAFEDELINTFISSLKDEFDEKLRFLRKERFELDVLLKQADLLYISKLEEFMLNRRTFIAEQHITTESARLNQALKDNQVSSTQLRKQMIKKNEQMEQISKTLSDLWVHFQNVCMDKIDTTLMSFLTHLYKRKVPKKTQTEVDQDEHKELDTSESLISVSDITSGSSMSMDLNYCPDGLDQDLYDAVVELQEQRQALDDQQNEVKQDLMLLNKELEHNAKEAEILKRESGQAGQCLQTFYEEKIKTINEIIAVVPLLESHIYAKVADGLVLNRTTLSQLHIRVDELKEEIKAQVKVMKDHSLKHVALRRAKRLLRDRVHTLEKKCDEEILKKFGKPIKINTLELVILNPRLETLKCQMVIDKDRQVSEQRKLDKETRDLKRVLSDKMSTTTARYQFKADLMLERIRLEERLDLRFQRQNLIVDGLSRKQRQERQERLELRSLLHQQAAVMHGCREEIAKLTRHGTSRATTLPPVSRHYTMNRPPSIRNVPVSPGTRGPAHLPPVDPGSREQSAPS